MEYEGTIRFIHFASSDEAAQSRVRQALEVLAPYGFDLHEAYTERSERLEVTA